jgi:hypothetical protein
MANVAVKASLGLDTGEVVYLQTTMAEGTETELQTYPSSADGGYSVAATSIGTFANGKTITSIIQSPNAPNGIAYAYIDRRGEIASILPVHIIGQGWQSPVNFPIKFKLQAGDTIRVMANTAADREFAYSVMTDKGTQAIFAADGASGNVELTHIKSGQGIGASLTGQKVTMQMATSVDGAKLVSAGGVIVLNDRGLPVGACMAANPIAQQPTLQAANPAIPIGLNFVARVTCSS